MHATIAAVIALLALTFYLQPAQAAECKKVASSSDILINKASLEKLRTIGITRDLVFDALKDVSVPETSGCWSGYTGNFDGQIISLGVLQWNYGQSSLQNLMTAYQNQFATDKAYDNEIKRLMPQHGDLIFSPGCLKKPITTECRTKIIVATARSDNGSVTQRRVECLVRFAADDSSSDRQIRKASGKCTRRPSPHVCGQRLIGKTYQMGHRHQGPARNISRRCRYRTHPKRLEST